VITVDEIKVKALRKYEEYLQSIIVADHLFFPLEIKGNKQNDRNIEILVEQHRTLFENEKQNIGFGYTLHTAISERLGAKRVIQNITFDTEADYLTFIHKEIEAHNFKLLLAMTLAEFAELKPLLASKPGIIVEHISSWNALLSVCRYFNKNPSPGLYIRELPIPVHTKFIEKNRGVLASLLQYIIPEYINTSGETFEDKFHLKSKHNLIRLRFLDKGLTPLPGFSEIGIAETEINNIAIRCKRVFIIENDIAALTFPALDDSIALFGKGYNLSSLKHIEWLKPAEIYYWSDMDVQGFEMLSLIRSYFPQTQSLLMDEMTFKAFANDAGKGIKTKNPISPYLTLLEKTMYQFLSSEDLRLEQEKISQQWVNQIISSIS
jgi:hypothetical protein